MCSLKILDDGGDATQMMIQKFPGASRHMRGVVEDTITGVHRCIHYNQLLTLLVKINFTGCIS